MFVLSIVSARCPKRDTHEICKWANTKHPRTESNSTYLLSTGRNDGAAMTAKFEHLDETKDLTAPAQDLVRLVRLIRLIRTFSKPTDRPGAFAFLVRDGILQSRPGQLNEEDLRSPEHGVVDRPHRA